MLLVELINRQNPRLRRRIALASFIAGLVNAGILAIVNTAAQQAASPSVRLFLLFLAAIPIYAFCARYAFRNISTLLEDTLFDIRLRVAAKARRADLLGLERIGAAEIQDRITENLTIISQSGAYLANMMQMAAIVIFSAIYLANVSRPGFMITGTLLSVGLILFYVRNTEIKSHVMRAGQMRLSFIEAMSDLFRGAKEIRFSRKRGAEIDEEVRQVAGDLRATSLEASRLVDDNGTFAQCTRYATLGAAVFVLPQYFGADSATASQLVTGILFLFIPLSYVMACYPAFIQANTALQHIATLEAKLDDAARGVVQGSGEQDPWNGRFAAIEARDIEFRYAASGKGQAFRVGPLRLTITSGEVLFIVGGNGSGKSTLLRALTGLYAPTRGSLLVDGIAVQPSNVQAYREMISVIFSDFHLFKKLYGMAGVDDAEVRRLLAQMQLDRKTSFSNQRFSTQELSTGQRKRLALMITLLEDRPMYAFDEWAAEQDPEFRRYFYEELIPDLKRRGKTVVIVTHDDRYFHLADRLITLEYGDIRSSRGAHPSLPGEEAGMAAV
ncbi:cyclic peptide export ABC transporter [Sorangium sp. So ce1036]|uniref:cyclic peptide export ABC transporter n=1 Tax=Sorangium sp. So ce1036 TaxID=3133328 RepID=UPI003F0277D2